MRNAMNKPEEYSLLVDHIAELKENEALSLVKKLLNDGHDSLMLFEGMKETVKAIEKAGLRGGISIIIGGGIIDDDVCKYVGADEWTNDAAKGVKWCKQRALGKILNPEPYNV